MKRKAYTPGTNGKADYPYQPELQIDFGAFFHAQNDAPVRYTNRPMANGRHDLIFLSSYIHDAEFRMDQVQRRGRSVLIPLNRVRWELYRKLDDLIGIPSELTIRPVKSMRIELAAQYHCEKKFLREPMLRISRLTAVPVCLRAADDGTEDEEVVIQCDRAWVRLRVTEEYRILLVDKPKSNR